MCDRVDFLEALGECFDQLGYLVGVVGGIAAF